MSQLTTHILDTSKGKPAAGVHVILCQHHRSKWTEVASGITNEDGRITNLLRKNAKMELGKYKLKFETQEYFAHQSIETLYPFIEIVFLVTTENHYHIPLLLNPFGYSTYRGS
ncbi:MAG: hydroxyisourate hydrolase [Chitinophagaceae bacterium]|nr:hydroxyisourate hydrolase [Chitinophagaceae bacterium]